MSTDTKKKPAKKPAKKSAATATKAKTTAKKAPAKKAAVDLIQDVAHKVENLDMKKAIALVGQLMDDVNYNWFQIGGALSVIQSNSWFVEAGYDNLKGLMLDKYNLKYRKGIYLIEIYDNLIQAEVPYDKVKKVGWTKLVELSRIIDNENVDAWVKVALDCNVPQLKEEIDKALAKASDGDKPDAPKKTDDNKVSTKSFKLHVDQREVVDSAVDKALKDTGSDAEAVAIEAICLSYISGGKKVKQKTMKAQMKAAGWRKALEQFADIYPEIDLKVKVTEPEEEEEEADEAE